MTGRTVGLPLFESVQVLGRERTSVRIDVAIARLKSARADDSGARCARGSAPGPTAMSTTGGRPPRSLVRARDAALGFLDHRLLGSGAARRGRKCSPRYGNDRLPGRELFGEKPNACMMPESALRLIRWFLTFVGPKLR